VLFRSLAVAVVLEILQKAQAELVVVSLAVKVALLRLHPVQLTLAAEVVAQVAMVDRAMAAQAAQA
jgi:hypothetical protein